MQPACMKGNRTITYFWMPAFQRGRTCTGRPSHICMATAPTHDCPGVAANLHFLAVFSEEEPDLNSELEISVSDLNKHKFKLSMLTNFPQTTETVEAIVGQLMEKQRTARTMGTMECACPDSTCLDSSSCVHTAPQPKPEPQPSSGGRGRARMLHHRHLHESSNQV